MEVKQYGSFVAKIPNLSVQFTNRYFELNFSERCAWYLVGIGLVSYTYKFFSWCGFLKHNYFHVKLPDFTTRSIRDSNTVVITGVHNPIGRAFLRYFSKFSNRIIAIGQEGEELRQAIDNANQVVQNLQVLSYQESRAGSDEFLEKLVIALQDVEVRYFIDCDIPEKDEETICNYTYQEITKMLQVGIETPTVLLKTVLQVLEKQKAKSAYIAITSGRIHGYQSILKAPLYGASRCYIDNLIIQNHDYYRNKGIYLHSVRQFLDNEYAEEDVDQFVQKVIAWTGSTPELYGGFVDFTKNLLLEYTVVQQKMFNAFQFERKNRIREQLKSMEKRQKVSSKQHRSNTANLAKQHRDRMQTEIVRMALEPKPIKDQFRATTRPNYMGDAHIRVKPRDSQERIKDSMNQNWFCDSVPIEKRKYHFRARFHQKEVQPQLRFKSHNRYQRLQDQWNYQKSLLDTTWYIRQQSPREFNVRDEKKQYHKTLQTIALNVSSSLKSPTKQQIKQQMLNDSGSSQPFRPNAILLQDTPGSVTQRLKEQPNLKNLLLSQEQLSKLAEETVVSHGLWSSRRIERKMSGI